MKKLNVILSKGPDDFGCWLENFKGIYGAGETPVDAVNNLKEAIQLYIKHNADAPKWLENSTFNLIHRDN